MTASRSDDVVPPGEVLAGFFEHTAVHALVYDLEHLMVLWVNQGFMRFHGVTPDFDPAEIRGTVHPEDAGRLEAHHAYLATQPAGGSAEIEMRIRNAEGAYRWLRTRETVMRAGDGTRPTLVTSISVDITEEREAKERLEAREGMYRLLAEGSMDMVCRHGPDGRYEYVSPASKRLLGIAPDALVGLDPYAYFHPDDIARIRDESHRLVLEEGEGPPITYRYRHADGHYVWLETTTRAVRGDQGQVTGLISVSRDVSARVEAEQEAARERALFDAVFQAIPEATLVVDPERKIYRANAASEPLWGYTPEELDGRTTELLYAEADGYESAGEAYYHPGSKFAGEHYSKLYRRKNGEVFEGLTSASAVVDAKGATLGFVGIIRDLTPEQRLVKRLRRANAELRRFAYVASHDLRQPLRTIMGFAALLEEDHAEALGTEGGMYVRRMTSAARRMSELISALLGYSRLEVAQEPTGPIALHEVIAESLADLSGAIAEAGAIVSAPQGEGPRVIGDAVQLRQVFGHLLSNALKFRGDAAPRVEISVEAPKHGRVTVRVRDEGIGIDPNDTERVFEVFRRLHARNEYEGHGMGLAIVRRIVERHGGTVHCESERGAGATFVLSLRAA
ncbi:MAG: PAS domain S-box protein [Myxococcota bacterium]